jgi:UDP-2,3-diacylglucosamine pyrophosphatase LpxH
MTFDPIRYRSLFLSDFHLGSPNCKAERLYKFLLKNTADKVYLVGDIIEGYHFGRWPPYHDLILGLLAEWVRSGIEIIFIPGNHDPEFRNHLGIYGPLRIARRTVHHCLDGRKMLVTHGDETDMIPLGRLLAPILALERLLGFSIWNMMRRYFSGWLDLHVTRFEDEMRSIGLRKHDGVICGHIHEPLLTYSYMNCGDWVHHCTAIAERHDGSFKLLRG